MFYMRFVTCLSPPLIMLLWLLWSMLLLLVVTVVVLAMGGVGGGVGVGGGGCRRRVSILASMASRAVLHTQGWSCRRDTRGGDAAGVCTLSLLLLFTRGP